MAKRLYVGNLMFSTTSADLRALFAVHGSVESAQIQVDRETGKSRGFGFVLMPNDEEADSAIAQLDGTDYRDRRMNVNEAQPQAPVGQHRGRGPSPGRPGPREGYGQRGRF